MSQSKEPDTKKRINYLLLSDWQVLSDWCEHVRRVFDGTIGVYLVGSSLITNKYRDIDVRLIMHEDAFKVEFPDDDTFPYPCKKLRYINLAMSLWGQKATALPIDFQVQSIKNKENVGPREPLGMKL